MRCGALVMVMAVSMPAAAQTTLQPKSTIATAPAPAEVPQHQLVYRSTNIFRFNPLGLMTDNQISFRRRLYVDDSGLLHGLRTLDVEAILIGKLFIDAEQFFVIMQCHHIGVIRLRSAVHFEISHELAQCSSGI